jgi:uncharacterized protein YdhG (YjbR/CyaY superfamily)
MADQQSAEPLTRSVDAYYASLPDEFRAALERLRQVIKDELPDATEVISYGLPTFKHKGRGVLAIGAWKKHIAIYPMSYAVIAAHAGELADFEVDKGTVRFPPNAHFDEQLLRKMVQERVAENEARSSRAKR